MPHYASHADVVDIGEAYLRHPEKAPLHYAPVGNGVVGYAGEEHQLHEKPCSHYDSAYAAVYPPGLDVVKVPADEVPQQRSCRYKRPYGKVAASKGSCLGAMPQELLPCFQTPQPAQPLQKPHER